MRVFIRRLPAAAAAGFVLVIAAGCASDSESPNPVSPPSNQAPVIENLSANPSSPGPGDIAILSVQASDADGDSLQFFWEATCGSFPDGNDEDSVSWQAPRCTCVCTVSVEVSDSEETVQESLAISVTQEGPVLRVEPDSLDFSSTRITLPFYITNSGTETLTWSATDDQTWISLSSASGTTTTETDSVLVTVLRGVLSPNVYEGLIEVTSDGGNQDVIVRMVVADEVNYTYSIVNRYPHDTQAFTQGLVYHGGFLYEGTGLRGSSTLRRVDIETGDVLQIRDIPPPPSGENLYFGEGITIYGDEILQLTWEDSVAFVYDLATFDSLGSFHYPGDGWGLTHDGTQFIMSDGTAHLYFQDLDTFERTADIRVTSNAGSVWRLNELEYIDGEVFANVWLSDRIARIDPVSGQVTGWINLAGLLTPEEAGAADVLNGIAWDEENERLFVTGKLWPWVFEIELIPAD